MKNIKSSILKQVAVSLIIASLLVGCSTVKGIFGKSATAEQKSAQKINLAQNEIAQNTSDQLYQISDLSFGVGYSLNQSINDDPAVTAAAALNTRVQNIAGLPDLDDQKSMTALADALINGNGAKALAEKDKEISDLQSEKKDLLANKDKAIADYMNLAEKTALKTDTLSSQLASYTSYWGLGAVAKGLWSFASHIFWVLLIGGVLYIALRLLADTNPTAAAVFSIFTRIGSLFIQAIEYIAPKSIAELELISSDAYKDLETEYNNLKNSIIAAAVTPVATKTSTTSAPTATSTPTSGSVVSTASNVVPTTSTIVVTTTANAITPTSGSAEAVSGSH
jgi:hypothetical protein